MNWPNLTTRRRTTLAVLAAIAVLAVVLSIVLTRETLTTPQAFDWKSDWAVEKGFDITIDAQGLRFPTAIAFVPDPGSAPEDPLYFVTELSGQVRAVTNDRTVTTFAENFFSLRTKRVIPKIDEEAGVGGICLAPEQGYVFVTFSYHDSESVLRNNIARFQTPSHTFSITPKSMIVFTEIFNAYRAIPSHQIGACRVSDGLLYVSVADGAQIPQSQILDSLLGKVLRMTLDGEPVPDNPFYQDDDTENARNYVWAYGLRNPFGLDIQGDDVFVADNGPDIDRFIQVERGLIIYGTGPTQVSAPKQTRSSPQEEGWPTWTTTHPAAVFSLTDLNKTFF